jgi:hypothetical protein
MPVFNFDFSRSVSRINMSAESSGIFTPNLTSLELHDSQLARFNDIVQRFAPEQPAFTLDQIAGAARRVLRASTKGQDSAFIKVRMRRAGEVRAACNDPHWSIEQTLRDDMLGLIAYLDDENALIHNAVPVVGLLDDAILIDMAMNKLRAELDDYADFCRFRMAEAARQNVGVEQITIDRAQWQIERDEELKLEQQLRRVRSTSYARGESAQRAFRIC